ncbi:MAG TPA: carbohydrate-binding family 9-like protein [Bryobacteraceae bacterium]|nr:carbohydrate-binding family 9-like protein [Bryobacteraceae bacterium]
MPKLPCFIPSIISLLLLSANVIETQSLPSSATPANTFHPVKRLTDDTKDQDEHFAVTFQEVQKWIQQKAFPGAVLAVGQHGKLVAWKSFGKMDYSPDAARVPRNAIFDLASLTKVTGTTTAAEILYDRKQLDLNAPVTRYIPEFAGTPGHDQILVRNLLSHSSGLNSREVLWKQAKDRQGIMHRLYTMPMDFKPGEKMQYRDYNLILMGEIVTRITGERLDQFLQENVFGPLKMKDTGFNPSPALLSRIPPTEQDDVLRHELVHGIVHDENAFLMGGVSGHAGLFSSAHDLAILAQMYLNGGIYNGKRIVSEETLKVFMERQSTPPGTSRALGWDTPVKGSFPGASASPHAIIHTGFTGTSIYIDPDRDAFIVLLTNRVNPTRRNNLINEARPAIHTAVLATLDGTNLQTVTQPSKQPIYEVDRTDRPIDIDGKLDDPAWAGAPAIVLVNNNDGSTSPIRTECKILYDANFIYFGFRNEDKNIWATMTKRDAHLWEEEVNEVFVQADPRQTSYIELEINPLGAIFDAFLLDIRKPLHYESWNSEKIKWAVHVDGTVDGQPGDREWTSEIALPLEDVVPASHTPPQSGDRWRVNLYRIEKLPIAAKLAWSPTGKDFHVPAMFGQLVFTDRRV